MIIEFTQPGDSAAKPAVDLGPAPEKPAAYRVLARKYRPSSFDDLIGQEPMVRTLSNAFDLKRIHQAYILTGVRGVGKTTTARILARAFNYDVPGEADAPTIHMPKLGVHCQAIIESRHVDVIEMDAASHTGIDDVREIIESARFSPMMARTKVYIIDEVHMLSKQAFNGLLKTLEEPPEHVKFLFATTEIEKVPVTVRSRCQRFDLRRVEADVLIAHLAGICSKEGVNVEDEALAMIARAAEGSVRDCLSLLDQAIAHAGPEEGVRAGSLRAMLGLADRTRIIDMFEALMMGQIAPALDILQDQHHNGADPAQILTELAEFVHFVTRLKLVPSAARDAAVTQAERERGAVFAATLSMPVLTRAWQILVKGLVELKDSPRPLASADMVLVRLAFAADLPTPDEALRRLASQPQGQPGTQAPRALPQGPVARLASSSAVARQPVPEIAPDAAKMHFARFDDVVAHAGTSRDIQMKMALERDVRLLRFEQGTIEFSLVPGASAHIAQDLTRKLLEWTGQRWMVAVSSQQGGDSLKERAEAAASQTRAGIAANPLVVAVLARFPGARIVAVRPMDAEAEAPLPLGHVENPAASEDIGYSDTLYTEDDL